MKLEFFPKLAMDGIRKNKRLYTPYILACIGMVAMLYIITFLSQSPLVYSARGGYTACMAMEFGSWVIAVFSCIFLFYTNAFLIRRRKKEFGLYNILGMEKRHIGVILFWETLITALIALAAGLCVRRGSAHPWFRGMTAGVVYILLGIVAFSIAVGSLSLSASNALDVLMGAAVGALTAVIFGKKTKPEAKKAA